MNDFLAGRYDPSADFDKGLASGKKTAKAVEYDKQLASEIQYAVVSRKLKPSKCSLKSKSDNKWSALSTTVLPSSCLATPLSGSRWTRN